MANDESSWCADVTYHSAGRVPAVVGNVACDWSVGGAYYCDTDRRIPVFIVIFRTTYIRYWPSLIIIL